MRETRTPISECLSCGYRMDSALSAISVEIANDYVAPFLATRGFFPLSEHDRIITLSCILPIAQALIEVPEFEATVREVLALVPHIPSPPEM